MSTHALTHRLFLVAFPCLLLSLAACGDDADDLGVGAQCTQASECGENQQCLTQFKGGYCGLAGCKANADCPDASACVTHSDGKNYCFRVCKDKGECNANRSGDNASNCSSNITFASGKKEGKACVPPSS